jgi:glycine/D-amino acid oxidase-like deaminating enzyme
MFSNTSFFLIENICYFITMQPKPFWKDSSNNSLVDYRVNDPLPKLADIVIIGGGLSGVSLLYWFAQLLAEQRGTLWNANRSPTILLLERQSLASGATGNNGGHLFAENEYESQCVQEMLAVLAKHNKDSQLDLHIHSTAQNGYRGQIHPIKLVASLAAIALSLNPSDQIQIHTNTPVLSFNTKSDLEFVELNTSKGILQTKYLVLATNGFTRTLVPELSEIIVPTRGQCVTTNALDIVLNANVVEDYDDGCGVYAIQRASDGRIVLGGYRHSVPGCESGIDDNSQVNPVIHEKLTAWLGSSPHLKQLRGKAEIEYDWTGIMAFTPDENPLVGPLDQAGNLNSQGHPMVYITAGFTGHGMPRCFWAAKAVALQLVHYGVYDFSKQAVDASLGSFARNLSPTRFNKLSSKL